MRSELSELLSMLTFCRPMGSGTERSFIDRYIATLPGATIDHAHNWHVSIGENNARILWSSHTDTVHHSSGRQTVSYDPKTSLVKLSKRSIADRRNCLGADCTTGVWLMRNMILRGVPGYYVFHYGEERGGIGSSAIQDRDSEWLQSFDFAIAFDRRGTTSVITEQSGGRTASDLFALSLSEQLNAHGFKFAADDWGIFTDTAVYADDVPECSNVSVGYEHEHSVKESQDCDHALRLLDAMCAIDLRELIVDRNPAEDRRLALLRWADWQAKEDAKRSPRPILVVDNDQQFEGICLNCGDHTLIDGDSLTCEDCEACARERRSEYRGIYLDESFEAVQNELIDQLKRRKA